MEKLKIKHKEYPFLISLSALMEFEDLVDKSFTELDKMKMREMNALVFCGLKYGAINSGDKFLDYTIESLPDALGISGLNRGLELATKQIVSVSDPK